MSKVTHTPSPWYPEQSDECLLILSANRDTIAQVYAVHRTDVPYDMANARLIAAAPNLLEVLKSAQKLVQSYSGVVSPKKFLELMPTMALIEDAIAKAEGR